MAQDIDVSYSLFGGYVRDINVQFGFNQNPTSLNVAVIAEKNTELSINIREPVSISIGAFNFVGIVQSWDQSVIDEAGTGVYQVRLTDTKPILESAQVILGSPFQTRTSETPYDYGDNVISITPSGAEQIIDGFNFQRIKTFVEASSIRYGRFTYNVVFDFTLPSRGTDIEYLIRSSNMNLVELISQIANDHGMDWYVETSIVNSSKTIFVKMINRSSVLTGNNISFDILAALHEGEIIKRRQGKENRDSVIKSVLIGGNKAYLHKTNGNLWSPFWGFRKNLDRDDLNRNECKLEIKDEDSAIPNAFPDFSIELMEAIINQDYSPQQFTEEEIQRVLSYANEFWGRKFYARITPESAIDDAGKSWVVPTSAGWWESEDDEPPVCFDHNGQLKFETDDGRWVTFVQLPLPGTRSSQTVNYQWDDTLFSNPNSHVGPEVNTNIRHGRRVWVKATLEIAGPYFILTLSAPLRVKKITQTIGTVQNPASGGITEVSGEVTTETRLDNIETAWLALLDQRTSYGPWSNRTRSNGRTEVLIDDSLTPWNFGYHGITHSEAMSTLNDIANARIKTIADITTEVDTIEMQVANVPQINLGQQLNRTGTLTNLSISFGIGGITTTYKSNQYTSELSRHQRYYQDLIDRLRRKATENNDRIRPFEEIDDRPPEPVTDSPKESRDIPSIDNNGTLLGRIYERVEGNEPKYNLIPMAWVSDVFGELTLMRDPRIFGQYLRVVNMGERQTAPGRLPIGTDVEVKVFDRRAIQTANGSGIISSYYIDVPGPRAEDFVASISERHGSFAIFTSGGVQYEINHIGEPRYGVTPNEVAVQRIKLTSSEYIALDNLLNIGEPSGRGSLLKIGTEVTVKWNENIEGSFTPYLDQPIQAFRLPTS